MQIISDNKLVQAMQMASRCNRSKRKLKKKKKDKIFMLNFMGEASNASQDKISIHVNLLQVKNVFFNTFICSDQLFDGPQYFFVNFQSFFLLRQIFNILLLDLYLCCNLICKLLAYFKFTGAIRQSNHQFLSGYSQLMHGQNWSQKGTCFQQGWVRVGYPSLI